MFKLIGGILGKIIPLFANNIMKGTTTRFVRTFIYTFLGVITAALFFTAQEYHPIGEMQTLIWPAIAAGISSLGAAADKWARMNFSDNGQ